MKHSSTRIKSFSRKVPYVDLECPDCHRHFTTKAAYGSHRNACRMQFLRLFDEMIAAVPASVLAQWYKDHVAGCSVCSGG